MHRILSSRFFCSVATQPVPKELLMRLRKSTGYTFQNCKRALEKFGADVETAEKWLHERARKEGWSKMNADRKAANGVIGVMMDKNVGMLLELNCETDFVARNEKFRQLGARICAETLNNQRMSIDVDKMQEKTKKWNVDVENVSLLKPNMDVDAHKSESIRDMIAFNVGQLGERIVLSRVTCLMASGDVHLFGYVHPKSEFTNNVLFGQFGTVIAIKQQNVGAQSEVDDDGDEDSFEAIGNMLCQHIIGMNPRRIGSFEEERSKMVEVKVEHKEKPLQPSADGEVEDQEIDDSQITSLSNDKELLKQDFLLQPDVKVGTFLKHNNLVVHDFIRFECGETAKPT